MEYADFEYETDSSDGSSSGSTYSRNDFDPTNAPVETIDPSATKTEKEEIGDKPAKTIAPDKDTAGNQTKPDNGGQDTGDQGQTGAATSKPQTKPQKPSQDENYDDVGEETTLEDVDGAQ